MFRKAQILAYFILLRRERDGGERRNIWESGDKKRREGGKRSGK